MDPGWRYPAGGTEKLAGRVAPGDPANCSGPKTRSKRWCIGLFDFRLRAGLGCAQRQHPDGGNRGAVSGRTAGPFIAGVEDVFQVSAIGSKDQSRIEARIYFADQVRSADTPQS